jgi:hypothetical protein
MALCQLLEQSPNQPPALEQTPSTDAAESKSLAPVDPSATPPPKEKMARVFSNEPPLLRLARDRFGAELTETDAKFFLAVANNDWADLRTSPDATFDPQEPSSWAGSPTLKADRLIWVCTDPAATKLVPSRGVSLRGVTVAGKIDLYRSNVPFSVSIYDCLFTNGLNISHAKLQELDLRNCCSAAVQARAVQINENLYFLTSCVFGGLDFIDANIGGDFDFSGGFAFFGMKAEDLKKQGVALNLHDAKVAGDVRLGDKFRALGQVRLIGATIGRSLTCGGGKFKGGGQTAIDARRAQLSGNVFFTTGFLADGGVELRRAKIGGDLDCNGGRFIAPNSEALSADLVDVGGQVLLGDGFHAEGEVRLINATVAGDVDCDNGHFLRPEGDALTIDGAVIGRSLRIGLDPTGATDQNKELPTGFLCRGTFRMWSTQVNQDMLANGAQFDSPTGNALLACNLKVASRVVLTSVKAKGTVNLFSADIEHELDLRGSEFNGEQAFSKIAFWGNGMHVRGHVFCNQVDGTDAPCRFVVKGLTSFQFATISMHWDLTGAELINPGGDALDASDCRVGGYINLDTVKIDGRATFSRAKIDGMWIINKTVEPEKLRLDMRFAHIWVIKDERLEDWPPAGQLQLEGLVYDHFDDDSPLDVNDRLIWLRRQYTSTRKSKLAADGTVAAYQRSLGMPASKSSGESSASAASIPLRSAPRLETPDRYGITQTGFEAATMPAPTTLGPSQPDHEGANNKPHSPVDATAANASEDAATSVANQVVVAPVSSDPAGRRYITQPYTQLASVYRAIGLEEQANLVLVARAERMGELAPTFSAQGLWYRYAGRLIGYGYEPFRAIKIGLAIILGGAIIFTIGARRNLMAETKLAEQILSGEAQPGQVSPSYPRFNAIVYSLDVFLPFVDLNQVCYWIPGVKPHAMQKSRNCLMHIGPFSLKWSAVLHCYLWFQTLAGWTLCTLLAAAVTGIVQS